MTITLDTQLEQIVRRQAAKAGYLDVAAYVRDRLSDPRSTKDREVANEQAAAKRRAEVDAWLDRFTGSATRKVSWEKIAAETRSEVY
ncbi:MAG: hypothetical protein AAF916_08880 [Planctomycetota bacterium]